MIRIKQYALALLSLASIAPAMANDISPINCNRCELWNTSHKPFQLHANAYYVGTDGLSSVLITSPKGHILIDGALPQSAPQIADNIKALGFDIKDVRWILNSHAHYDHAGGIAALQRMSGAKVGASKQGAIDLRKGMVSESDPQYGYGDEMRFPAVKRVQVLKDGQFVQLGNIRIKVNYTPGHTEGATSYSWRSCNAVRCYDLVFADSLNPVSADGFLFTQPPARLQRFQHSIDTVRQLSCDIIISAHPDFTNLFEKISLPGGPRKEDSYVDKEGCKKYADAAAARLAKRVNEESGK